ncbi:MAG TPA: hypothetical protein VGP82_13080 [Ktedonobacterales bacterium]|nr:hypothetical protein [Ktedonobacterales bacterium]
MATTETKRLAQPPDMQPPLSRLRDLLVRRPHRVITLLAALYIALWVGVALLPITVTDLDAFFLPSARLAAAGHPFEVYSIRYQHLYPNANGPLSLIPLTLATAIAQHAGWLDNPPLRRAVVMATFAVIILLLAHEAVRAVERLAGHHLNAGMRAMAYALFALAPPIWHSVMFYGHVEQPLMLWLVLVGIRLLQEKRAAAAGILLGLALLTRTSALLDLMPMVLLLLWRGRWRAVAQLCSATLATLAAVLLPFWLVDRDDLVYSLVTFRAELTVAGGNVWGALFGTPLENAAISIAQRYDSLVVLGVALALCALVLTFRPGLDVGSRDLYGLLVLATLCFALFIKTLWPYYFLEPYIFATIWWLGGVGVAGPRRAWWLAIALPAGILATELLGEVFATLSQNGTWLASWSRWMVLAILAVSVPFAMRLISGSRWWCRLARYNASGT